MILTNPNARQTMESLKSRYPTVRYRLCEMCAVRDFEEVMIRPCGTDMFYHARCVVQVVPMPRLLALGDRSKRKILDDPDVPAAIKEGLGGPDWKVTSAVKRRPTREELAERLKANHAADVAVHYGVTVSTIYNWARTLHLRLVEVRGRNQFTHQPRPSRDELVKQLSVNSLTIVAQHYCTTRSSVSRWAKKYGINVRELAAARMENDYFR